MNLVKYSEKLLIWMHREDVSQKSLADKLFQTRQSVSQKIKENNFTSFDKSRIAELGFKG